MSTTSPQPSEPSLEITTCCVELRPLMKPGGLVFIGDLPGTQELPQLVMMAVKHATSIGLEVIVGLEIPMTERLDGGPVGSFFRRRAEFQDGRSSQAMAQLVSDLNAHRLELNQDQDVADDKLMLVAMDGPWVAPGSPVPLDAIGMLEQPRDEVMAHNLLSAMDRQPQAFTLVLAGPMHTRLDRSSGRTLGSIVAAWHPDAVALRVAPAGGTTWVLSGAPSTMSTSGAVALPVVDVPAGALWANSPGADGHHGVISPGLVTASRPWTD